MFIPPDTHFQGDPGQDLIDSMDTLAERLGQVVVMLRVIAVLLWMLLCVLIVMLGVDLVR